jgi:hypothetical protein
VERRKFGSAEPTVKIDGKSYVLATQNARPVFSSGTRAIEGAPSDDDRVIWNDWSQGAGINLYRAAGLLATEKGRLIASPTANELTTTVTRPVRHWFEEQDSGGRWYLFAITDQNVVKIDLGVDPPVIRKTYTLATAGFNANDRLGKPIKALNAGTVGIYIPVNNGDRIVRLTVPVTVNDGVGVTDDTFTAFTTVLKGAAHFRQMASGKVIRAVSSHTAAVFGNRAQISILSDPANFESDAAWGADFNMDNQTRWILGLANLDELIVVGKQNGWFAYTENADGTLTSRNLLPDAEFDEITALGSESFHGGYVWHNYLMLPTPFAFWRHTLAIASPVGPDVLPSITGDENISDPRFGVAPAGAAAGAWQYIPYNHPTDGFYIYAGRERRPNEDSVLPIIWHPFHAHMDAGARCESIHIQRNGTGAPRLWHQKLLAGTQRIMYHPLGKDGGPFGGGSYSSASQAATDNHAHFMPVQLPSQVLLREVRYEIEEGDAQFFWSCYAKLDGAAAAQVGGSELTATGSLFWATDTKCRRLMLRPSYRTSGSYTPVRARPPRLMKVTVEFTFLPDVSDDLQFVVDVAATAMRRHVSEKKVRDDLRALRNAGAKSWIDVYGQSGTVNIAATSDQAPKRMAALEIMDVVSVKATLMEYS